VKKSSYILALFILLLSTGIQAQTDSLKSRLPKDSVARLYDKSVDTIQVKQVVDTLNKKAFKPDPFKVLWMAAIIPGYGQILNKKYWKLPIVYGGFLGCAYAITWNSGQYNSYKTAYLDILRYASDPSYQAIVDKNPTGVSFYQIIPKGLTIASYDGISGFTPILKSAYQNARRYRDLSIIVTIAYYALTLVDAYVDAQLYDFDISPNLSMHIQPAIMEKSYGANNSLGLQCSISLK
jgi:hypothetical protein